MDAKKASKILEKLRDEKLVWKPSEFRSPYRGYEADLGNGITALAREFVDSDSGMSVYDVLVCSDRAAIAVSGEDEARELYNYVARRLAKKNDAAEREARRALKKTIDGLFDLD